MADHYYTQSPQSESDPRFVEFAYRGKTLRFQTDAGTFSRDRVDPGSELLLLALGEIEGQIADVGCGWGAMGLSLALANPQAHVTLIDINQRAVELTKSNAQANKIDNVTVCAGDGLREIDRQFDVIITNPPIRAGKDVIYGIFAQAAQKLCGGGEFYAVIRKQQGAPSAQKHLAELFGNCQIVKRGGGYHVLYSIKNQDL